MSRGGHRASRATVLRASVFEHSSSDTILRASVCEQHSSSISLRASTSRLPSVPVVIIFATTLASASCNKSRKVSVILIIRFLVFCRFSVLPCLMVDSLSPREGTGSQILLSEETYRYLATDF